MRNTTISILTIKKMIKIKKSDAMKNRIKKNMFDKKKKNIHIQSAFSESCLDDMLSFSMNTKVRH